MTNSTTHAGACLCGAVRYTVNGPMREVIYCHCEQCRRTSGHFVAASACARTDLVFQERDALRWFESSDTARRGFCGLCGSSLFWEAQGRDSISIMAGSLEVPTQLGATQHIFVESASDYYTLSDGLPQSLRRCQNGGQNDGHSDARHTEIEYR